MKTLMTLMLGLVMVAFNAFAAVNINTASQEQLETLKGVGPAKARAIIDYRTKNGPFKKIEDLDKVQGIGEGLMKNLKSEITLTGATTVKADTKASPKSAKADDKKADAKADAKADTKADVKAGTKEAKAADKKADAKDAKKEDPKKDAKVEKSAKKDEKK
jgi:competence protein ComEA